MDTKPVKILNDLRGVPIEAGDTIAFCDATGWSHLILGVVAAEQRFTARGCVTLDPPTKVFSREVRHAYQTHGIVVVEKPATTSASGPAESAEPDSEPVLKPKRKWRKADAVISDDTEMEPAADA